MWMFVIVASADFVLWHRADHKTCIVPLTLMPQLGLSLMPEGQTFWFHAYSRLDFRCSLMSGLTSLRRWLQPTFACLSDWCYFDSALQMSLEIIGTHPVTSVLDILLWFVEPIKGRFPKKMFGNTTTPRIKIGLQCVLMVLWLVLFH